MTANPTAHAYTPDPVQLILTDAARLGVTLQAAGDKLRYQPQQAMTLALKQRIQAHKPALLAHLTGGLFSAPASDNTPWPTTPKGPDSPLSGVLSVLSVSEPPKGVWSQGELAILRTAGKTPQDLPLVATLKDAFSDWPGGVVLVSLEPDPATAPAQPAPDLTPTLRQQAAHLLRQARRIGQQQGIYLRDAWHERLAICTITSGLSEPSAMAIALDELKVNLKQCFHERKVTL